MANFNLVNRIKIVNPSANVDVDYGPYNSLSDAKTAVLEIIREKGKTVGIIESGSVVEYWWKDGIGDGDLVPKTSGGGSGMLNWSGSTENAIGTYISVSGICAQPNLTFDGTTLEVNGNVLPRTTHSGYLGSSIQYWKGAYIENICFMDSAGSNFSCISVDPTDKLRLYSHNDMQFLVNNIHVLSLSSTYVALNKNIIGAIGGLAIGTQGNPISTYNVCDYIEFHDKIAPSSPMADYGRLYMDSSDEKIYFKNSSTTYDLTSTGGGGSVNMSGNTNNGLTTYVDPNTICSEPNLTFDGSALTIVGNISFCNTVARFVQMTSTTTSMANEFTLKGTDLSYYSDDRTPMCGGIVNIIGGQGYNTDDSGIGCACGGNINIVAGAARLDFGEEACGGHVNICGGCARYDTSHTSIIIGGDVNLYGGTSEDNCGCVALHYGTTKVLHTTITGTYTTGVHFASTCVCSPIVCGTTSVCSPIVCATSYLQSSACALVATNLVFTTGSNSCLAWNAASTGVGSSLLICGNQGATATAGGTVTLIGGAGGAVGGNGGNVNICGGNGTGTDGHVNIYSDTDLKLNTHSTGVCVTGSLNASTTMCATTCVCSPIVCATGKLDAGTCVVVGTNIVFDSGGNRYICWGGIATGVGSEINIQGQQGASTSAGGRVTLIGGCGGSTSGVGGHIHICGGGANGTATGGNVYVCGGSAYGGGNVYICTYAGFSTGTVYIHHGTALRFNTTATGTYTTGVHFASTCVCSPIICATGTGYKIMASTGCGCAVDWVATSDYRIKKNIEPITNALSKIECLCGVCYELCEDSTPDMGLIAQDVFCVEPRLVSSGDVPEEYKKYGIEDQMLGLKYDKFAGLFVEAIKELQQQNLCLQLQINALKNQINK